MDQARSASDKAQASECRDFVLNSSYVPGSRGIRGPHATGNLRTLLPLDHANVILSLQVQPELRAVAEIAAEPHRGIGRDAAAAIEDVGDPARRNADIER